MPPGTNDNKQYGAPDFERYYAGQMTAEEMHALEKAALDDPFLADALEGYKSTYTPVADAAWLRQQLEAKTRKARVVPIPPRRSYPLLRIAALVLLLVGAGWSVYYLMDRKRSTLALETKEVKREAQPQVLPPLPAPDTSNAVVMTQPGESVPVQTPTAPTPTRRRAGRTALPTESAPPVATTAPAAAPAVKAEAEKPMLMREAESNDIAAAQRKEEVQDQALQGRAADAELYKVRAANTFQGRVVNQNNQGVPNATVSVHNSRTGITTNEQGYFSLNVPDTSVTASVNAPGYESRSVTLNKKHQEANIVLQQSDAKLSEVVVVGYGKKQKKSAVSEDPLPRPATGWAHFNEYVQKNRKPAKDLSPEGLKGVVTLSFDVSRKGAPTDIKVDSSLSLLHDAEAIRLLKEGPRWEGKKNTRGKVTISFE